MISEREQLLMQTYEQLVHNALIPPASSDFFDKFLGTDLVGIGTAADEIIFSTSDFKKMIDYTRLQGQGFHFSFTSITPLLRKIFSNDEIAVFSDLIKMSIRDQSQTFYIDLRFTAVMQFEVDRWILLHFHGSKPEYVKSEEDTLGIKEWQRKNEELEKLVDLKTAQLQQSVTALQESQAQLVHAEKMASLGELTAGIAHEIQNPLNFVNNFSEVNAELIEEAQNEINNGNQTSLTELLSDIKANSEKITFHGKRADSIVKSMLQHSRQSSGQKELTDINALCDEYLRLAYHGLRAKDKSFTAQFETDFDATLPKVNVVSQDIGRVILNLINNAFYAVNERHKKEGKDGYIPQVKVTTRRTGDQVEITVTDNGGGIPANIREKIFQPFFTTKPTGEGTGLGLSMSYDIITKGHGGKLTIFNEDKEGAAFAISLPI